MQGSIYGYILDFAVLYLLARLVESGKLRFYIAGIIYALIAEFAQLGFIVIGQLAVTGGTTVSATSFLIQWPHLLLVAVVATAVFFLLERYEETIAASLVIFMIGFILLVFVL